MDPELKRKWIEALRSGEYAQGTLWLRNFENEYCCLGVLCDVAGLGWERGHGPAGYNVAGTVGASFGYALLPDAHAERLGIRDLQVLLSSMNDNGESFAEIADYIEEHL